MLVHLRKHSDIGSKCALFDLQVALTTAQKLKRPAYDYRRANFEEMNRNLMNIDFEFTSSNSTSGIDDDWNFWRDTFLAMADEHIPRKIVKGRYNPPWITPAIISLIKKKETIRQNSVARIPLPDLSKKAVKISSLPPATIYLPTQNSSGPFSKRPPSPVAFHSMYPPLQTIQTPRV